MGGVAGSDHSEPGLTVRQAAACREGGSCERDHPIHLGRCLPQQVKVLAYIETHRCYSLLLHILLSIFIPLMAQLAAPGTPLRQRRARGGARILPPGRPIQAQRRAVSSRPPPLPAAAPLPVRGRERVGPVQLLLLPDLPCRAALLRPENASSTRHGPSLGLPTTQRERGVSASKAPSPSELLRMQAGGGGEHEHVTLHRVPDPRGGPAG